MILYETPYDPEGNIADAYNGIFDRAKRGDWVCIRDGDTQFTTQYYGDHLEQMIRDNPGVMAFTCITNRINNKHQKAKSIDRRNDDMKYHCAKGEAFWNKYSTTCIDVTEGHGLMSGVLFFIKKELWTKIGGVQTRGMLGVDNEIHKKIRNAGAKLFLMKGFYIYHRYSFHYDKDKPRDITHLRIKEEPQSTKKKKK